MSKHTQGKWIAVGDWVELDDDTRADICSVNPCDFGQSSYGRNDDEMRANARLIAAAPAMLEALERLIASDDAHATIHAPDGDDVARMLEYAAAFDNARAALRAAKGEA